MTDWLLLIVRHPSGPTLCASDAAAQQTCGASIPCYIRRIPITPFGPVRQAFMNILIIGGGGREHALAWKLAASPLADRLYCAPGNAGIAREAECVALDPADHGAVVAFCKAKAIDFVVIGPEGPLVAGLADDLETAGIRAFGPSRAAA